MLRKLNRIEMFYSNNHRSSSFKVPLHALRPVPFAKKRKAQGAKRFSLEDRVFK